MFSHTFMPAAISPQTQSATLGNQMYAPVPPGRGGGVIKYIMTY